MEPSTGAMAISKTRWAARRTWAGATSPNSCSRPGNYQGNRKSDHNERNHQTHDPVRDLQERKDLSCDLNREPPNDHVGDRHLVDVAAFQFGEEVALIHFAVWRPTTLVGSIPILRSSSGNLLSE